MVTGRSSASWSGSVFPSDSDTRHMVIIADEAGVKVVYAAEVRTPGSGIEQA